MPSNPERPMRAQTTPSHLPELEIAKALSERRVLLAFQPIVGAGDRVAFHEALLRLRLPCGQLLAPGQFLLGLRNPTLRRALDIRALSLGIAELNAHPGLRLSVNVDPDSLHNPVFHRELDMQLRTAPETAERLILELTERAPLPPLPVFARRRDRWREMGLSLALDDFGAGCTSFRHLRDWRFDILKIDGSFSRNVHSDPDNQALMRALCGLAQHFEAYTVAEAVETAAEARWLTACGLDACQGYHLGRPTVDPAWRPSEPAIASG
ncbi:EAL domain-containing protein [Meridianimarinicoccus aquatilis]|uniref:EAL domain-containing protein n=2 Tax=Meridianimarinicoccus aquatilis TaxID=2552766 RepID=A0A4R6AW88_9RHOB|nr:EAL domain-containing protein [Fluviibacterium aquatile]